MLGFGLILGFTPGCLSTSSEDCSGPNPPGWCTGDSASATGTDSDTGSEAACEPILSEPSDGTPASQLTIVNDRDVPIWIPADAVGCIHEPFSLWREGVRQFWFTMGSYPAGAPACDTELISGCLGTECSNGSAGVVRLDPGASRAWTFPGQVWIDQQVSAECAEVSDCDAGRTCQAARNLGAGALEAHVLVSETCDAGPEFCECGMAVCEFNLDWPGHLGSLSAVEVPIALDYQGGDLTLSISP